MLNLHASMILHVPVTEIPTGTATNFTLRDEYTARVNHFAVVENNPQLLAEIAEIAMAKTAMMGDWGTLVRATKMLKWKEAIVDVRFQIRDGQTGDYKVVGEPMHWIVSTLDSSDGYVVVAREANYTIPSNKETGAAAVIVAQTALELYPYQADNDYHLGKCVAKLRIDEGGFLQFGPCGPYAQHGVLVKAQGDAAMKLFHFAAASNNSEKK